MFNIFNFIKDKNPAKTQYEKKFEMHDPFRFAFENTSAKIMIVEPNDNIRETLSSFLTRKGSEVISYDSAPKAIAALNNHYVDIVISDINLPGINGTDFCQLVKNNFQHVYFIMLTAKNQVEDVFNAISTGANECISKPFDFMDIIEKIHSAENIINTHKKLTFLNERLEKCVNTDHLTEIKTMRFFNQEASKELRRAKRYKHNTAILMLDVDHFKNINDTHGHIAGDKALKAIANRLVKATRESDLVCRYGGEEFIILFPEISHENALIAAEKIRRNIQEMEIDIGNDTIKTTISIGVAVKRYQSDYSLEQVIYMADKALYKAKNKGRNNSVLYDEKNL